MNSKWLRLFGPPRLEIDGVQQEIKSRKGLALLAYLAVIGRPVRRDVVANLLWPEYDQTRARANLRRTLYNLNQTPAAELLEANQESIVLVPDDTTEIDVRLFTALLDEGVEPDARAQAVELHQADFLAGFYLPDSEPFEQWVTVQREGYRRRALKTLEELGEQYLANGDLVGAERWARRQLETDNLREPAWRQLMTALARAGRRAEALAEYDRCRHILQEELGVEPAPETAALAASLRADVEPDEAETRPVLPTAVAAPTTPLPASPYRGLFAFREVDAPYFFGREEFVERLANAVADASIVAVIGPSGSGKSSVVYAGLLPEIVRESNWVTISFRPGKRPFSALAAALIDHLEEDLRETARLAEIKELAAALRESRVTLYDVVARIRDRCQADRLLLVADQFEELYTLVPDEALRQHFLDTVLELVFDQQFRPEPLFTLVLTLRADFTGQALAYRPLGDALQNADVKLGPMTRAELRRAIVRPAHMQGVAFEPGLVARILDDVGDEPGNLPLLEFALANLWEQQEAGHLTHQAYEAIGRVEGSLARHAEETFAGLTAEEQAQARRAFIQLVRPGEGTEDTRRLATRDELGADWALLPLLADARLVITGRDAAGNETAEIVHEALIRSWGRLRDWLAADRAFRVWQERLRVSVREWEELERDRSALLRGLALSTAENQMAERPDDLSTAEKEYIMASVALRREREARQLRAQAERERLRRRFTLALGVGMVLALFLAVAALLQWRAATEERDAAEQALARQLAAQSEALLDDDLPQALLLAVEGVRRDDSPETQQALVRALEYSPRLARFFYLDGRPDDGQLLIQAGLFPGGRIAAGGPLAFGVWDLFDNTQRPSTVIRTATSESNFANANIALSPDGRILATLSQQRTRFESGEGGQTPPGARLVQLFDASTAEKLAEFPVPPSTGTLTVSPDSSTLAAVAPSTITLWDLSTGEWRQELVGGDHPTVSFSPDGRLIAGGGLQGTLLVWDVESGDVIESIASAHDDQIFATAFSPDGRYLASGDVDGAIQLWDAAQWTPLGEPLVAHEGLALLRFSPDGQVLVSFGQDGPLQRWLTATQEKLGQPLRGHQPGIPLTPVFGSDGQTLISAMIVGELPQARLQIIEWHLNRAPLQRLVGHNADVPVAALDEEAAIITSVGLDGEIRNWSLNGQPLSVTAEVELTGSLWGMGLDPTGRLLVRGTQEGPVLVYDTQTGEQLRTLDEPPLPIAEFDFTADGQLLAGAGCAEGTVVPQRCDVGRTWVWDVATWQVVSRTDFEPFGMVHNDVAIGSDGQLAAAGAFSIGGDSEPAVYLWDVATGSLLAEEEALPTNVAGRFGLAIGPDGDLLTANSSEGFTLFAIDERGQLETQYAWGDVERVMSAAFSPDGDLLAAGDEEGTVHFWDVASGQLLQREEAHTLNVMSLDFVAGGQFLLTAGRDGTVVLLDVNQLLSTEIPESSSAIEIACSRANRNLTRAEWERHFGDEPYRATCPEQSLPD